MKRSQMTSVVVAALVVAAAVPALAAQSDLAPVREATAEYRSVAAAEADGYERFLDCFDSPEGGMGQHYVDLAALDDIVDPLHPEAMVYEVRFDETRGEHLRLVAVEWVVPGASTDEPPELFEQHFHFNPTLGIWALHAWVWERNPSGLFADWNPEVGPCPGT
jgi:hypothetical protein